MKGEIDLKSKSTGVSKQEIFSTGFSALLHFSNVVQCLLRQSNDLFLASNFSLNDECLLTQVNKHLLQVDTWMVKQRVNFQGTFIMKASYYALVLLFIVNLQLIFGEVPFQLEKNCPLLLSKVCTNKERKLVTKSLYRMMRCKSATCKAIDESNLKSIITFNEFICSQPDVACEKINQQMTCIAPSCLDHWFDWDSGSDILDISTAFAKLKSVSGQKCVDRKNKLNAPADPKSFYKWYFEPGNLDKVEDFFRDCRGLADLQTFRETLLLMPVCWLADKREKQVLKNRLIIRGFLDTEKAISDFCSQNSSFRSQLYDLAPNVIHYNENQREASFRHDLCDLKLANAIDFFQAKVQCLLRGEKSSGENCFTQKVGPVPPDKSQFVSWSCRTDFPVDKERKGGISAVINKCQLGSLLDPFDECGQLVHGKRFLCSPKPMLTYIGVRRELEILKDTERAFTRLLQRLAIADTSLVNECYTKVGKLSSPADVTKGEKLREAICNSKEHFISLEMDLGECLKNRGFPAEYIKIPASQIYQVASYDADLHCAIPIYGKPAEECFTNFTQKQLFKSKSEFAQWEEQNKDSRSRLMFVSVCLEKVKQNADANYKKCVSKFHFDKSRDEICTKKSIDSTVQRLAQLNCMRMQGQFEDSKECQSVIPSLTTVNNTEEFQRWFCQLKQERYFKLDECEKPTNSKLRQCIRNEVQVEGSRVKVCLQKNFKMLTTGFSSVFCAVKTADWDETKDLCKGKTAEFAALDSVQKFEQLFCKIGLEGIEGVLRQCFKPTDKSANSAFSRCTKNIKQLELNKHSFCAPKGETSFPKLHCDLKYSRYDQSAACLKEIAELKSKEDVKQFNKWYCSLDVHKYLRIIGCVESATSPNSQPYDSCLKNTQDARKTKA